MWEARAKYCRHEDLGSQYEMWLSTVSLILCVAVLTAQFVYVFARLWMVVVTLTHLLQHWLPVPWVMWRLLHSLALCHDSNYICILPLPKALFLSLTLFSTMTIYPWPSLCPWPLFTHFLVFSLSFCCLWPTFHARPTTDRAVLTFMHHPVFCLGHQEMHFVL